MIVLQFYANHSSWNYAPKECVCLPLLYRVWMDVCWCVCVTTVNLAFNLQISNERKDVSVAYVCAYLCVCVGQANTLVHDISHRRFAGFK
jgi:hypothetical protein